MMLTSHSSHQPHGSGVRGLNSLAGIDSHEGRFGRLFPELPPAQFGEDDLFALAQAMNSPDAPKDGPDALESDVPSAYTYLGQFIDHDLTFDPSSFRQQRSDPEGIVDFRTPRFDLDNVYGRGSSDQPYLYDADALQLGDPLNAVARNMRAHDLPRAQPGKYGVRRAIIGDPRNDENVIVSQLQGLFFRFHNAIVEAHPDWDFDRASREVRWHYQWVVLHDFLPRIVRSDVLDRLSLALRHPTSGWEAHPPRFRVYPEGASFLPVEFSVAAYRLGHSMVRPGYRLNENVPPLPIFDETDPTKGLNAFGEFNKAWTIDWQRFIDLGLTQPEGAGVVVRKDDGSTEVVVADAENDHLQLAYKIDTSMVEPLMLLPESVSGAEAQPPTGDARLKSLAYRNLLRGVKLRLPSGQDVARRLGAVPLADEEILIGAAELAGADKEREGATEIGRIGETFVGCAPLWVYVLAESRRAYYRTGKARLGTVGGTIVAETFLALMLADEDSFLHAKRDLHSDEPWTPTLGQNGRFTLADLIKVALGLSPAA